MKTYAICLYNKILYKYGIVTDIGSLRYLTDLARSKYGNSVTLELHTHNDSGLITEIIY